MTFLTDWQTSIDSHLADMAELAHLDEDLELMYGVIATGLLWPVRARIELFDAQAVLALEQIAPEGNEILLQFAQAWSFEKLSAARELPFAAKRDKNLRASLDQIITHFNGLPIFLRHMLRKMRISTVYNEDDFVQRLLPTIGNLTTVRQLYRAVDLMLAGTENIKPALVSQLQPEELLKPYLTWFVRQHEKIELRGIKQPGSSNGIPLESVYVALRGDRTSPYERQQSHAFLEDELNEITESLNQQDISFEERRTLLWQALGKSPWMLSLEERDRPHLFQTDKTEKLSMGEAFCRERWLAILGDPGSGKTTVARWLTLKLAQAFLAEKERLVVPASQVDPTANRDERVDLGPVRLPILVRISEFADACRNKPGLLLVDFLGQHSWLGRFPAFSRDHADFPGIPLPSKQLNLLMKDYLKQGKAVIVLDGLDEISVADNRTNVIQAVEKFITDWILLPDEEEETGSSGQKKRSSTSKSNDPSKSGGNQIVVTSRIAGYHADPLSGQIAHFTIDPMNDGAVDAFCEAWMNVFYEDWEEAFRAANAFKMAIHDPQNPGVRDLASNPLLLTILALIYQDGQSTLPRQRVSLYQRAVDNLAQVWQQHGHGLQPDEVIYVLIQIAYHIHETYPTGLIEETTLRELVAKHLAGYRDISEERPPLNFDKVVSRFMEILREEVGLLAARGERLYGFLHLSFQEYFAALYLVQNPQSTNGLFAEKLDKPRWREPLLLAFSYISIYWSASERKEVISAFLKANDDLKHLLPRSAILLANAMSEMTNQPSEPLIRQMIQSLLDTYSGKGNFISFDLLYTTIEEAFQRLNKTSAAPIVEMVLVEELQSINQDSWSRGFAAAQVMFKLNWFTAQSTRVLLQALPFDSAAWDWVINKSLIQITKIHPEYLPSSDFSLRNALQQNSETLAFVKQDIAWLRVITLLFGGIVSREGVASGTGNAVEFLPTNIYRDALLSQTILHNLQDTSENRDVSDLEAELRDIWQNAESNMERTEALLGLSALGVSLDTLVGETTPQQTEIFEAALSYADLMTDLLKPLFASAVGKVKEEIVLASTDEATKLDLLRGISRFEMGLQTNSVGYAHVALTPKASVVTKLRLASSSSSILDRLLLPAPEEQQDAQIARMAMYWAETFERLNTGEAIYQMAISLDTVGSRFEGTSEVFARSMALLQETAWSSKCLYIESFPPTLPSDLAEVVAEALNLIDGSKVDMWRHWALLELTEVLATCEYGLRLEALAIGLSIEQQELKQNVLSAIDTTLAQDGDISINQVLQQLLALENPLHRARGLWRLLPLLASKNANNALKEAITSTALISDEVQRSRMYWRIANSLATSSQKDTFYLYAYQDALQISNPLNKTRALARLVNHFQEQKADFLANILAEISMIENERSRAEMLQRIQSLCASVPDILPRFTALVADLSTTPLRRLAQDQLLPQLLAFIPQTEHKDQWMIIILLACLKELGESSGLDTIWHMLFKCVNELRDQFRLPADLDAIWDILFPDQDLRKKVREKLNTFFSSAFKDCLQSFSANPRTLKFELNKLWRNSQVDAERAEAFLALAAMGTPLNTFCDDAMLQNRERVEAVIAYADQLGDLLRPLLLNSADAVKQEIKLSAAHETAKLDLIRAITKFTANLKAPVAVEKQNRHSTLMALWEADVVSRMNQNDDAYYSMMVTLDTMGSTIETTPRTIAKSLAFLQEIHWSGKGLRVESFPSAPSSDLLEIVSEALNLISGFSPLLNAWQSWIFEEMGELFTSVARELRPEALAICLSIEQQELKRNALQAIDATQIQTGEPSIRVLQQALALENPLYRARSLWRLFPLLSSQHATLALNEAINSTVRIPDPVQRSRMYWRLANLLANSSQREAFYQYAYQDALQISDPLNKARALARLVNHFQEQKAVDLLANVLAEIPRIANERSRAEMLQRIQSLCASVPDVMPRFIPLVEELSTAQLRWLAQDQLLPQLFAYKPQPENNESYMLVSLMVCLQELRRTFGLPTEIAEIWIVLIDKKQRARAMNALLAAGAKDGLRLTTVAADVLTLLINQKDMPTLTRLLPLVQEPDLGLQAVLLQWQQSPDLYIQQIASLLLTETNFLSANTLQHVFTLLEQGEDRLKCRAALAIYDKKLNRGLARFKLSGIGPDTLFLAAQTSKDWRQHSPGLRMAIDWFYENLWIDDGDQIEEWARQAQESPNPDFSIYSRLLMRTHILTRSAWDGFLHVLEDGNDDIQCLLLHSYIYIFDLSQILLSRHQQVKLHNLIGNLCLTGHSRVRRWAIEAFGYHLFISEKERQMLLSLTEDPDDTLATQAVITLGRLTNASQLEHLRSYLNSPRPAIRDAADEALFRHRIKDLTDEEKDEVLLKVIDGMLDIMEDDPVRLYQALLRAGQHRWYGAYATNTAKLGGLIVERFASLLLERVMSDLTQILERPEEAENNTIEGLLDQTWMKDYPVFDIAAAAATRMPAAFANLADAERLEPHLVRCTRYGRAPQRTASITLLSFMRRLSTGVAEALRNGLNDIVYSQEAVLQAVLRFRNIDGDTLSHLASGLSDPSAAFAYATVQLFQALGTAETTSFADRQEIMKILAAEIENPASKREVYVLKQDITIVTLADNSRVSNDGGTIISYMGSLNSAMYQALMQISGVGGSK